MNSGIYSDRPFSNKKVKNISGGDLYPPIHSDDDYFMCHVAGIRPAKMRPVSFAKTKEEKLQLANAKSRSFNKIESCGLVQKNTKIEHLGRLVIYVKNNEVDSKKRNTFKTTYRFNCVKSDVEDILSSFKTKKLEVIKYYFNY